MAIKTKTEATKMIYTRWRKERGIKLVVSLVERKATCEFEGKVYTAKGLTHALALESLFKQLKEKANLDPEPSQAK